MDDRLWSELARQRREDILACAGGSRCSASAGHQAYLTKGVAKFAKATGRMLVRFGTHLDPLDVPGNVG